MKMTWLFFAFLTAFFESLKDVTSKFSLKNVNEYVVTWAMFAFSLFFLLPLLFFIKIPSLNYHFFLALIAGGFINIIAFILYTKAINIADLSVTVPLVSSTPLFLLFTSPFIVHEYATFADVIGIILIVVGAYFLNFKTKEKNYLAPLQSLLTNRGSQYMLGVAFLWSFSANIDKVGVQNSSTIFWAISNYAFIAIFLFPIAIYKSKSRFIPQVKTNFFSLLPVGLTQGLVVLFQMKAIEIALVSQVISVKRLSTLLSVFWGYLLFQETHIKSRAIGASIMILGVIFISL
jgi:uncharacterized membrane protein